MLPVWIGSIALALAGAFLVKWSFDQGLLGPTTRVVLGLLFGVTLLGAGELARRSLGLIAAGMTAAGIAVLYASLLAGINLYDLIPRHAGFVMLALVTFAAVTLSLRQGIIIALVGLVGGFVTPAMIGSEEPQPGALFTYLLLLQIALLVVIRKRGWWILAPIAMGGGFLWVAGWLIGMYEPTHALPIGGFLVTTAAAAVFSTRDMDRLNFVGLQIPAAIMGWIAIAIGLTLIGTTAWRGGFNTTEWIYFVVLGLGAMLLSRLDDRFFGLEWLGPAFGISFLWFWGGSLVMSSTTEPATLDRFAITLAAIGAIFAIASYACGRTSERPRLWPWLCSAIVVAYFVVGYWWYELPESLDPVSWGAIALGLAPLLIAGSWPYLRKFSQERTHEHPLAALLTGALALVSLAVPIELERAWITVAWALMVAAISWLFARLNVRILAYLAAGLATLVTARLLLNPFVLEYPIGERPFLNWLAYGYGIPIAAFVFASRELRIAGQKWISGGVFGAALAFVPALLTLWTRHYFQPDMTEFEVTLRESASYAIVWLAFAVFLTWLIDREGFSHRTLTAWFARGIGAVGLSLAFVGPCLVLNPIWSEQPVGETPLLNALAYTHFLPTVLVLAFGWLWKQRASVFESRTAGFAGLVLSWIWISLSVRQYFQGSYLDGAYSSAELYTYSAAWILFGTLLLVLGIATGSHLVRFASLAVMLLSVGKVFLFDMGELKDLYRVFSFLGLGISLLLLAFLYQKFVFGRKAE